MISQAQQLRDLLAHFADDYRFSAITDVWSTADWTDPRECEFMPEAIVAFEDTMEDVGILYTLPLACHYCHCPASRIAHELRGAPTVCNGCEKPWAPIEMWPYGDPSYGRYGDSGRDAI